MGYILENLEELKLGSVIAEDILVNTKTPIIRKGTKVTREHIQVLKAFSILKVSIAFEDTKTKNEKTDLSKKEVIQGTETNFLNLYIDAVNNYQKEFSSWEAGMNVDVAKLRMIIMPLVERVSKEKQVILKLNGYSAIEEYVSHHSIAVGIISGMLAQKLGYPIGQVIQSATAGLMADSGMAKVNTKIRNKKSLLTEDEYSEIKKHTIHSFQMIKDSSLLKPEMKLAIFQHHERLDGSGYPKGEKMGKISIFSQIIAVADVFHAMTSERIYRAKSSIFKVLEMIKEEEFGKYNIEVVNALISLVGVLPISTRVLLSNGEVGEVVFLHRDSPMRPMIRILESNQIIDLSANRSFNIECIVQ